MTSDDSMLSWIFVSGGLTGLSSVVKSSLCHGMLAFIFWYWITTLHRAKATNGGGPKVASMLGGVEDAGIMRTMGPIVDPANRVLASDDWWK